MGQARAKSKNVQKKSTTPLVVGLIATAIAAAFVVAIVVGGSDSESTP